MVARALKQSSSSEEGAYSLPSAQYVVGAPAADDDARLDVFAVLFACRVVSFVDHVTF